MQPTLGIDGLGGLVGIVQVADHHVVAADDHLARLAGRALGSVGGDDPDLDVIDGPSRGPGDEGRIIVVATHGGDSRRLGEAVAGHHLLEAETVAHGVDHLDGDSRSAGHSQSERRQVKFVEVGVVQDRLVDGRRTGEHGDSLLADPPHYCRDVEHWVGNESYALHQAGQDPGVEAEGVEERIDHQIAVAGLQADDLAPREEGPADS